MARELEEDRLQEERIRSGEVKVHPDFWARPNEMP
jgi:hypothetical protein